MLFTSTRNNELSVKFSQAVRQCIPDDGGVFIPSSIEDLRRWIYYINEETTFCSIAGTLTSAFIQDEFSPIICETIATDAFPFEPKVRQLDDKLFIMELYHGHTGLQKDFGVSYLVSYLESTAYLNGGSAVFLDFTHGGLGALLARALRGKHNVKAVVVYQKGTVAGISDEDFAWNGGNIYPVEMEGSEEEIKAEISKVFADKDFVARYGITVSNTTNVCRLLGQIFLFPYSFAQIKNKVCSDIYYACDGGNYGTIMAGLYSWRFALPVSGFFVPATAALGTNFSGSPVVLDSFVNLKDRNSANPVVPANLERLESFFSNNSLMMKHFVYPVKIDASDEETAAKELFTKYGVYADRETARAYASVKQSDQNIFEEEGCVVLTAYNHPSFQSDYCKYMLGEAPDMPDNIKESLIKVDLHKPYAKTYEDLMNIIKELK